MTRIGISSWSTDPGSVGMIPSCNWRFTDFLTGSLVGRRAFKKNPKVVFCLIPSLVMFDQFAVPDATFLPDATTLFNRHRGLDFLFDFRASEKANLLPLCQGLGAILGIYGPMNAINRNAMAAVSKFLLAFLSQD